MKYHFEFEIELKKNIYDGTYIALEGIDGSGKTSQIQYLKEYFHSQGKFAIITREPRKDIGLVAEINNRALQGKLSIPRSAFQYLFTADRIMHLEELVLPALKKGQIVISDRCIWSAIPYGSTDLENGFNADQAQILLIAQGIQNIIIPDITFYIDISVETSLKRMGSRPEAKEIYESEETIFNVLEGYHWLIKHFPDVFSVVNGEQPMEDVAKNMIDALQSKLK